jgi:hypothetical protein
LVREPRQHLNETGQAEAWLGVVGDGSFCNRTVLAEDWNTQPISLVVRARKDSVLCKRARGPGPRFFGKTKFTPEQVRRWDGLARWQWASIFHGGRYRSVRYKDLSGVYWQSGARKKPLRLLILAGLEGYGPTRTDAYLALPKWRRRAKRASCQDLVNPLRKQLGRSRILFAAGTSPPCYQTMVEAAAA